MALSYAHIVRHTCIDTFHDYYDLFMHHDDLEIESQQVCALFDVDTIDELRDLLLAHMPRFTQFFAFWADISMRCELYDLLCQLESSVCALYPKHPRLLPTICIDR